jgi:hypothetical protein
LIHQLNKSMRSLPLHLRENKRVTCKVNKSNHPATRSGLGGSGGIISLRWHRSAMLNRRREFGSHLLVSVLIQYFLPQPLHHRPGQRIKPYLFLSD